MKYIGRIGEYFEATKVTQENYKSTFELQENQLALLWFEEDGSHFTIDAKDYHLKKNQIICLTEFNQLETHNFTSARYLKFSKPFYCILDHDSEVGCKGVLFYGSATLPIINPEDKDLTTLNAVWDMLQLEMAAKDQLQLEMLQMMLKRILILCTRIYKTQENYSNIDDKQSDVVREFHFLVEKNYRTLHTVSEYADMMNRSPKTLSNLFKKLNAKTPLQLIQARIMLEVRRLLTYTDKPVSEIAYQVGFNDIQSFSRFFKKHEGVSPSSFRVKEESK